VSEEYDWRLRIQELDAEIERLTSMVDILHEEDKRMRALVERHLDTCNTLLVANERAASEIGGLQLELRALRQDDGAVIAGLQGEIERLEAELKETEATGAKLRELRIEAAIEVARLNTALDEIIALDHYPDATIARLARGLPTTDRAL
jgi:uncharacterized small protein (DUF1192 family)